jgi:hypothetical protein
MADDTKTAEKKDLSPLKTVKEKIDHPYVFRGFSYVGKAVIIVPLIIIGLAILLKVYHEFVTVPRQQQIELRRLEVLERQMQQKNREQPKSEEEEMLENMFGGNLSDEKPATRSASSFDLTTARSCSFDAEGQSIQAYIKDEQVYAEIEATDSAGLSYVVVTDDCFYQWEDGGGEGTKMCGISSMKSMLDTFSMFGGGMDMEGMMMQMLPQMGLNLGTSAASLPDLQDSCTEQDVDDAIFTVPDTVSFTEESMPSIPGLGF